MPGHTATLFCKSSGKSLLQPGHIAQVVGAYDTIDNLTIDCLSLFSVLTHRNLLKLTTDYLQTIIDSLSLFLVLTNRNLLKLTDH